MASFTCSMIAGMMLLWVISCSLGSTLGTSVSYEEYCKSILMNADKEQSQQDIPPPTSTSSDLSLGFRRSFYSGGSPLFDANSTYFSLWRPLNRAYFTVSSVKLAHEHDTQTKVVEGSLMLLNGSHLWSGNNATVFRRAGRRRHPFPWPGATRLTLKGLWVVRSRILCMAGCFAKNGSGQAKPRDDCQVRAVFHYPMKNSISQPLVKGTIESMREHQDPLFFEQLVITGVSEAPYVFRKDTESAENWPLQHANVPDNIKIWKEEEAVCQFPWYKQPLSVAWDKQCTGQDCSPFKDVIPGSPTTMLVENMACKDGKVHGFFIFNHASKFSGVFAVEGAWNTSTGQFGASACYLKGVTNESMETFDSKDCDIQITLQFPITLTLLFRYSVIGTVERKKASTFPPFKPFSFTGHMDISYGSFGWGSSPLQIEYAYTEEKIRRAQDQCKASSSKHSKKGWMGKGKSRYPDGEYFSDFGFQATLKDTSGSHTEVYFSPIAINNRNNMFFSSRAAVLVTEAVSSKKTSQSMNISFDINFFSDEKGTKLLQNTTTFPRFPAEGVYNQENGMLCLSACRPLIGSQTQIGSKHDDDKDCEVLITLQYPPINPGYFEKHVVSGKVTSLRGQKDSLYFPTATVSSDLLFYQEQAANSLEQMDFEIIMGIISLTMAGLFIGIQLRHVKKNPKVLIQMSLLMLTVLTLGHLIPLVLNFEAIFSRRPWPLWSGGWLEINEVIVRLMTMMVFLMLIRLFYLAWVSKNEVSSSEGPWQMEQGSLRFCLAVYVLGGLVALIVYGTKGSNFLDVTKASAGLTVDFFLFPQVVGNYIWEIQGSVLSAPFYVGMTLVRALPHLYDILRKLEFLYVNDRRYYYANPSWDFYSKAWDSIIPIGNLLLALVIFLQQRYGGACLSIASWRKSKSYIQVSMNPI